MDISQLFVCNMGVNLGSGDVGVTEKSLDGAEVGAVGEQVGGETVADDMGRDFLEIPASMARCLSIRSTERGVRRV